MPIDFTCPHCGKQTSVEDRYAGCSGPCAACGQMISIPPFGPTPVKNVPAPPEPGFWKWFAPVIAVVICVLVLAALLLPAIQAAREAARRTQCNNNLKNISLALQNYHDTYKTFPMGVMHAGTAGESERLGPSWWFGTMPFCTSSNLYDKINGMQKQGPGNGTFNAQNYNAHLPGPSLTRYVPDYMRCPSSPLPTMETQTGPIALPSYVGISGGCDIMTASPDYQGGGGAMGLVPPNAIRDYINRRKGVGHVPGGIITASGMLPPCEHVSIAKITDGTSNTMIVGEQSDWLRDFNPGISAKYHGDAGWDTSGTGPAAPSTTVGGGFISGTIESTRVPMANGGLPATPPAAYDCYNITTVRYAPDYKRVLGAAAHPGCSEDHGINNPLQSPHPGGLLVVCVDGSVQFIAGTTDLAVLLRIAIRDDGQNVYIE